ncbi:MAG: nth [Firmicutes bacterium]|nr:nth [Bacillota bacterium]
MLTAAMKEKILHVLEKEYEGTTTGLVYSSPFELLIAVILSAQCTDTRVNMITPRLFPAYGSAEKMLALTQDQLETLIRDCGLYHSKARNILATCHHLVRDHGGLVPATFEELICLPGVGRKTANVVLSQLFDIPAIAVDTHVFRVANRLQLTAGNTVRLVEDELMQLIPKEKWGAAHHWLIWHGRKICKARKPLCFECPVNKLCPSAAQYGFSLEKEEHDIV